MIPTVRAELHEHASRVRFDLALDHDIDEGIVSVVSNLCRNAAEAGAANVICELRHRGSRIAGAVDDDGPGVDQRIARRIFTAGYSSKADTTGLGRGLGLDVVRRIVTARSGTVEVGRSPLGGARFAFELESCR